MTMMLFYLPNFLRDQWFSQRRRVAKGPIELTRLSDYILRDIGVARPPTSTRARSGLS
jgi:uncharacterized protein YjiS (DUF1127 family)